MYYFNECKNINKRILVFLCGSQFKKNKCDKRLVLKEYLSNKNCKIIPIILEEKFTLESSGDDKYLSYDNIFLNKLGDVETIVAAFSDGIIVIHDSITTGAEFAIFAINNQIENKICILNPNFDGVEENKISAFLEYGFLKENTGIKRIEYYPSVYEHYISKKHIVKRTQFLDNQIKKKLGNKIDDYINSLSSLFNIKIKKGAYNKFQKNNEIISYVFRDNDEVDVHISGMIFFYQIVSLFKINIVKKELAQKNEYYKHVDFIKGYYDDIMLRTILSYEKPDKKNFNKIKIIINESNEDSRKITALCFYMMQAIGIVEIIGEKKNNRYCAEIKTTDFMCDFLRDFNGIIGENRELDEIIQ